MDDLIQQYIDFLIIEKGLSQNSVESYTTDLVGFVSFLENNSIATFDQVDTTVIFGWLIDLSKKGLAAKSRARHLISIRGFFKYLIAEKKVIKNPVKDVDIPKIGLSLPKFMTTQEVTSLLETPDTRYPREMRNAAMMEIMYGAGLRVSELINLRLQDINLDLNYVRVLGKGSKERVIPIGTKAREMD